MKSNKSFTIRRLTLSDIDEVNKIQKIRGFKEIGIVGIYIYSRLPHDDYPNGTIAEVGSLYVVPEARGNNLGCKLVKAILDDVRKTESSIDAIVCDTTETGYAVFKKCGFIESTEHRQWIQL